MKLKEVKLKKLNQEEIEKTNGGASNITNWLANQIKEYSKGPGPAMELQYKHGMPGGKW
ncbi:MULTISPECIES: hypothetical protein [Bacillus cereus group]|uniref:Bacteriocin-type signal sequence n=1 Tax=Bacillus thuringiensis serovar toumanoffi TaxID=180862 RepID=A0ABD5HRT5_BACTU|nr:MULTISPECIES: hypothetical protein [Bacillus cereus group]EEM92322.1 hypothetical protein bthur0013_63420 [Bacillus thuringiensis IBL 200]MCR6784531.1 hypothetical protein [Bacillus thuringiensis]MCR6863177.1 hypothetical protein [Bacillus thuringiensis]MCR6869441.1 hypothetical protein [Bacillus thuringiensis]MCU7668540.1 hypothetical protein [Bacillus thuringiensis]